MVALEGRACALACAKLAHDFAPGLPKSSALRLITGTCLAELSKPCTNLVQTLRCLAVLLHLVGGPLLKEKEKAWERHSNVHLIIFFLLYLFGKHPYRYMYYLHGYLREFLVYVLQNLFGWQCEITNISGSFRSCHCQPHQPSSWRAILIHSPQPYQVAKSSLRTSGKASNDFLKLVLEATIIPCFSTGDT